MQTLRILNYLINNSYDACDKINKFKNKKPEDMPDLNKKKKEKKRGNYVVLKML